MFGDKKSLKDTERSLISETMSVEGTINSSGAIDVAGLLKGPVYSKEIIVRETGSVTGSIEADHVARVSTKYALNFKCIRLWRNMENWIFSFKFKDM